MGQEIAGVETDMAKIKIKPLDDRMQEAGLFYVRFMDDWVVIAPTRWKLRKAVREVNQALDYLKRGLPFRFGVRLARLLSPIL